MAMDVFGRSEHIAMFAEHDSRANFSPFQVMEDLRFRPAEDIENLIENCGRQVTVFKPLCDCQWGDQILDRHHGQAFWFYRSYRDVAASAVKKWGAHHADTLRSIAQDRIGMLGWRIERLSPSAIALVKQYTKPDMSDLDGSALFWFLRNNMFFDYGFHKDPRFHLFRYEHLVASPIEEFERMTSAMEIPLDRELVDDVVTTSIGKGAEVELDPAIATLCDGMMDRLDQAKSAQVANA